MNFEEMRLKLPNWRQNDLLRLGKTERSIFMGLLADATRRARDLVAKGWTTGLMARDEIGRGVGSLAKEACSFCALGAITRGVDDAYKALPGKLRERVDQAAGYAGGWIESFFRIAIGGGSIGTWNDHEARTKEEVVKKFGEVAQVFGNNDQAYTLNVDVTNDDRELGVPRDPEHCAFARAVHRSIARRFRRWEDVNVTISGTRMAISYHTKAHPETRFTLVELPEAATKYVRDYDAQATVLAGPQHFQVVVSVPPYQSVAA